MCMIVQHVLVQSCTLKYKYRVDCESEQEYIYSTLYLL